jgi:hypothetical protein
MDMKTMAAQIEELQARAVAYDIALRLLLEKAPEQTRKELLALANHLGDSPPIPASDASLERTSKTLKLLCQPVKRPS